MRTLTLRLDEGQGMAVRRLVEVTGEKAATRAIARAVRELPELREERDELRRRVRELEDAIARLAAAEHAVARAERERQKAYGKLRERVPGFR